MLRDAVNFFCLLLFLPISFAADPGFFESPEHLVLGDNIVLRFAKNDPGKRRIPLQLMNGLFLTYGEIVTLADYYAVLNSPISHGQDAQEQQEIFLRAFNSFALDTTVVAEVQKIMAVIQAELNTIIDGMKKGRKPEDIFDETGGEFSRKINCITGGSCEKVYWLKLGRALKISIDGFDHFNQNAWIAYQVGHQLAIKQATLAHQKRDKQALAIAYAMNAYACHFLSDRFAAGHIRTPFEELARLVQPQIIGSILAKYMHDEENVTGMSVYNLRGNHWIAYGDRSYLNTANKMHRHMLHQAMQLSADHIFHAFLAGRDYQHSDKEIYNLIPFIDNKSESNISPLFYWDNQGHRLLRRNKIFDPNEKSYTQDWYAWSTLFNLVRTRGLPIDAQVKLGLTEEQVLALH